MGSGVKKPYMLCKANGVDNGGLLTYDISLKHGIERARALTFEDAITWRDYCNKAARGRAVYDLYELKKVNNEG